MIIFKEEKKKLLDNLNEASVILSEVKNKFSLDLDDLQEKVSKSIDSIKDDRFSIAFFGSFSSGKSTILSILTNIMDIKISPEPTTDMINLYEHDDYLIVDTPGLFSEKTTHDEITQKYISEANIVIYTIEADNPIRDSHLATLKWLLNDILKKDSTIFVINKMDMVADVEDESDFTQKSEIKKKEVLKILHDLYGAVDKEPNFKIIAISADPFAKGLPFWRERPEDYRRLSRIQELELALSEFKEKYRQKLILKAGISVIYDIKNNLISELRKIENHLNSQLEILKNQEKELSQLLNELKEAVNTAYHNITDELINLRGKLISEIHAVADREGLARFYDTYIGKEFYILQRKVNDILDNHISSLNTKFEAIQESIKNLLDFYKEIKDKFFSQLSDKGKEIASITLKIPTEKIEKIIRELLVILSKSKLGEIGKIAKFSKRLVIFSVLLDIKAMWDSVKFNKDKKELINNIDEMFKELLEKEITKEKFESWVKELEENLNELRDSIISIDQKKGNLDEIMGKINAIKLDVLVY